MAEIGKTTDLTETEGQPTAHAYVDLPQDDEDFKLQAWARSSGVSIETRATPQSSLSTATAATLLAACGCACTFVLDAVGAPIWAKISGLIVPAAIFFGLRLINRGSQSHPPRR
jgi:hypothetical protein